MAQTWNPCNAKSRGEQRLSRLLEDLCGKDYLLSFSIDFLPGVREIDLLLVHQQLGLFIVEVKAVPIHAITEISPNSWKIRDRDTEESPLSQAHSQFDGLRSYWKARLHSKLPPVAITACLPEISRREWLNAFKPGSFAASIGEGMIFKEDLLSEEALTSRLERIMYEPAIRSGRKPIPPSHRFLQELDDLIRPRQPEIATLSDRSRLQAIERTITRQLKGEFPIGGSKYATFSGAPGTGKTFRLLSIALMHAYGNQRVLFVCFNKTLASDIRRLLSFEQKLDLTTYGVEALDVNQLAGRAFDRNGLPYLHTSDADDWGRLVVEHLIERGDSAYCDKYDTVLIDEAHDMQDWQLDLIRLHAKPIATICLALGKGQELYRDDSFALEWLKGFAKNNKIESKRLNQNFRNPSEQFYAAAAFHAAWPDSYERILPIYQSLIARKRQSDIQVARSGEALGYVPIGALKGEFEDDGADQLDIVSDEYAELIESEIQAIVHDPNAHPVGLLILVPDTASVVYRWVAKALQKAIQNHAPVSFIDYTKDDAKRASAATNEIRLCTFHSARGLEGERVIVFGLEQIESFCEKVNVKPENLAFIALSRGIFRCTVVTRSYYPSKANSLVKEILRIQSEGL